MRLPITTKPQMDMIDKNPFPERYKMFTRKTHFTDVIKNESADDYLLWRSPVEDFNSSSTLIVMPGEQAVFVKSGVIENIFDNGKYVLSTENYPFITQLRNTLSGGTSTFNCVIYFFRKAHSAEILWGTATPIQVRDKILGITTRVRGHGSYKLQIENPSLFLEKAVSSSADFLTQENINNYFANEFQSKIKSVITDELNKSTEELLGMESHLQELSSLLTPLIDAAVESYGLKCINFIVGSLDIEDSELRKKYDEIGIDAISKIKNAQADKAVMETLGTDWSKQQAASILNNMSRNTGTAGLGGELAMGIAGGTVLSDMSKGLFNSVNEKNNSPNADYAVETLSKLKELLTSGLISQEDFDNKKKEILASL